ncbi:MAG TPA: purine-nucleoside phosphorylase [Gemmatimonadaceae bacterium]|jgi:purine-nucleoside phosphorylase|nr:purine-nucleoside phosphorylase [Gemmatimonadaceae bacterium]
MTVVSEALPAARAIAPDEDMYDAVERAASVVRGSFPTRPDVAIVLGTGLGRLAGEIDVSTAIDYREIPGFPISTVESHAGRLLCGRLGGKTVVAMQGRFHRYEGYSLRQVTFPVRVLRALGAGTLVVSNASGGLNPLWSVGDVMLIADHINLQGDSPLIGRNDDRLGPRFPDLSAPYDAALRQLARDAAMQHKLVVREGVYVAVTGPNLETRAEYRFLRAIGADVVGMSTVPEVLVAIHSGMRVLGLSIVTDMCLPDALQPATVEQIIAAANQAEPKLATLVRAVLEKL